jgi:hypothetical protein
VAEIRDRIDQTFKTVIDQTRKNADEFVWSDELPDVEALGRRQMAAMRAFLDDFGAGKASGRYVDAELPKLPFANSSFDIAVCSHFLFLYSDHHSEAFHVESIRELIRVGRYVRVFPLRELGRVPSRLVAAIADRLRSNGLNCRSSW